MLKDGLIPAELVQGRSTWRSRWGPTARGEPSSFRAASRPPLSLLFSLFMHGSWLHLLGNMLFLWIFGNNIEDRLGRVKFVFFYLLCGVGASLAHVLFNLDSLVPVIGASGAVSGVMGAYLAALPHGPRPHPGFRFHPGHHHGHPGRGIPGHLVRLPVPLLPAAARASPGWPMSADSSWAFLLLKIFLAGKQPAIEIVH